MSVGFGVVGVGVWGERHARVYSEQSGAVLAAVCDTDAERAETVAKRYGAKKVYTDVADLVADPGVQAVSIATPDFAHFAPAMAAVEAGKHVLLEKPMATRTDEAEKLAQAVRKSGVKFMVDFHNRWNPAMHTAHAAVKSGEIGAPCMAYIRMHNTLYVPTQMLAWAAQSSSLWFLGSHCFDLLRFILDDEVETVYCVSRSRVLSAMGINAPDHFTCTFQFKGGATAVMENAWIMPTTEPASIDFRLDLFASEGAINVDISHNRTVQKYTAEKASYPNMLTGCDVYGRRKGFVYESIIAFAECIIEGKTPPVTVEDGLINTRVLCAAEESARTGQPVTLA